MSVKNQCVLPITDGRMTSFMILLEHGGGFVWDTFDHMIGGEVYAKKISSMEVTETACMVASEPKDKPDVVRT